jgi:hypothetical protein
VPGGTDIVILIFGSAVGSPPTAAQSNATVKKCNVHMRDIEKDGEQSHVRLKAAVDSMRRTAWES